MQLEHEAEFRPGPLSSSMQVGQLTTGLVVRVKSVSAPNVLLMASIYELSFLG